MQAFLLRSLTLLTLFFLGALAASLMAQNHLALPLWFSAITAWTLTLGFRRGLFIIIPFLLFADVLWDGRLGALFFSGFLLATAATYVAVRIETRSQTLQWVIYSLLAAIFGTFAVWLSVTWPNREVTASHALLAGKIFMWQLSATLIFYPLISRGIQRMEDFLDTHYREQTQKIR